MVQRRSIPQSIPLRRAHEQRTESTVSIKLDVDARNSCVYQDKTRPLPWCIWYDRDQTICTKTETMTRNARNLKTKMSAKT